jgi:tetratricopeptide (TPR) repeat protein
MGDGVLAYFGYPQANEHDAERGIRAGLGLVEAVPKLRIAAVPLQVRVGIATGLVVVGDLIGTGAAQEQVVVGETPNLAARLQALAAPGTVVIASSTRRLTGGLFEYRELGSVALKGFADNAAAWQVLRAGTAESRFEALRTTSTPLVGRDEEIDMLLRRWDQAKHGDGCVVLVTGEPGIGKSRIAETILERLINEPHTRLRYFCSPHHEHSALYPVITQLERAAGFRRDDTDEERLDKLEAVLAQGTTDLKDTVPVLTDLLSIPSADRYPPLNLRPEKRKEKILHVGCTQVEGLAARQPVLMVYEDVHWSDPTTRELLDLLIDRIPALRVLLIITFRPEFTPPWADGSHVTLLNLNRLPPRRCAEMIAFVTAGKALPKDVVSEIINRTDGVPLFIEELTKAVIESGVLADTSDCSTAAGPLLPTSLNASLLARLDRLGPVRDLAQIAGALGRQFSYELISAVADMPQSQVDNALARLVTAELIFQRGTPPNAEYTFKHALVQDAAYSTLLRSRRLELHARIVTTLEDHFPETVLAQPALLAQHCANAGLVDKAIVYRRKAARQEARTWGEVLTKGNYAGAAAIADHILDLAKRQGHDTEHLTLAHHAQLQTRFYSGDLFGAEEQFARLSELIQTVDLKQPPGMWPIAIGLSGLGAWILGRADSGRERIARVVAFAQDSKRPYDLAMALLFEGYLHRFQSEPRQAEAAGTQLLSLCEEHGFSYACDLARGVIGWARAQFGRTGEGVSLIRQALAGLTERGARVGNTDVLTRLAEAQALDGATREALDTIELALKENPEELVFRPNAMRYRGALRLKVGQNELAEADFRDAIAIAQKMSAKTWELCGAMSLARLSRDQGRRQQAHDILAPIYGWFTEGFDTPVLKDAKTLFDELAQ